MKLFSPIGPKDSLDELDCSGILAKAALYIELETAKHGLRDYSVVSSLQVFGVPTERSLGGAVRNYAFEAYRYLTDQLKGIAPLDLEAVILQEKGQFAQGFEHKVFIGSGYYTVYMHEIHASKDRIAFTMTYTGSSRGGFFKFDEDAYHAFLSASPSVLRSVFSELIPITTHRKIIEYAKDVGWCQAVKADETLVEALSQELSIPFASQYGIPGARERIENQYLAGTKNNPIYSDVPKSRLWITRNGLQPALDLYMDHPKKYLAAINAL
jgi:hypothetical protein